MEDLKQRLKFDDITVRSRCLQKLVQAVKRKSRGEIITSYSTQIPELNLIWETCESESSSTSNLAVRGIIYLVTNHYLDVKHAQTKLLSSLSTASNVYGVVKGITRLLIHQSIHATERNNSFNYSLYQPKHPLISVLEMNADYLPLVLESIADTVSEDNLKGFQVMEPVICYILSNPVCKKDCSRVLLLETLIEIVKTEPKTAFYILKCIPFLQVDDYHQIIEASNFILKAKKAFSSLQCDESDRIYISELLLLSSLSLSEKSLLSGHDPTRLLDVAIDAASNLSKVNYASLTVNVCLVLVAIILKRSSGAIIDKYVILASILLDFKDISPTVASFLAVSAIQLMPERSVISFDETPNTNLSQLLVKLETIFLVNRISASSSSENASSSADLSNNDIYIEAFTTSIESALQFTRFALKLDKSSVEFHIEWLEAVRDIVKKCSKENLEVVFSLVAGLFLMSPQDVDALSYYLETLEAILMKNTFLSTNTFALLLYKQNIVKSPESKFLFLEFLPKSATDKYAIPPVLSMLNMMSKHAGLKAQSIQLMLQLWKRNDRCFSYLHKLLLESNKGFKNELGMNDVLVSQAAAIREICLIAPEKHGTEFLGMLSKIFNESNDDNSAPAACLALDGVINLCKSEITDLRSTWKILGPNLNKDKRTLVTCRMYKLLSLVPELQVKSPEYDKFMNEIVSNTWKRISSGYMPPEALSAAYRALSKFPLECHLLKQLPLPAKAHLQLPASMKATPFEMSKLPEDVLTHIPGHCFIDLLISLNDDTVIEGYTELLNSLIKQEVLNLPRSVYSQRKHMQKRQNSYEILSKVPGFLCMQIDAGKSPTLQKDLAAGVLFCFEPPVEYGKDGEPLKRSLACQYRFYEQVLRTLLNEVNIDTTEWQRCILLPWAWGGFMERAFIGCEESRRAELELQRNLGHNDVSPEEFEAQRKCAWLWVRDRLFSIIQTNVKNAPTSHANAIFAVSGLIHACNKFYTSLDDNSKTASDDNNNFIKHQILVEEYTETILCSMFPDYKKTGTVHSWLLTHLSRLNSSSCSLIRGCSFASLCHLVPILVGSRSDEIPHLLKTLMDHLNHNSPVMSFYCGLGLGLFVRSLCDMGYPDTGVTQLALILKTAKEISKMCCAEESPSPSALIGLTIILTSLSNLADEECKDWVSTTSNIFLEKLKNEDNLSMIFEMLSICVSAMMISAADGSCTSVDSILNLSSWFSEKQDKLPQCSGVSVSSGMLVEALERYGHSSGFESKQDLQKKWFSIITSKEKPTLQKIAALNGLTSLYSCGRGLLQPKHKEKDVNKSAINDLISIMFQTLNASKDTGMQKICSWEVGRLYAVNSFQEESDVTVPSNYSYLGDQSILKPLVKLLLSNQCPEESKSDPAHITACLTALGGAFERPMPPLNWVTLLTPHLQQNDDSILNEKALNIAVNQAKGSPYATNLLSSYCCPPLFHTLPGASREFLLKNIPDLTPVLPPQKLKIFLKIVLSFIIKQESGFQKFGHIVMEGIQKAFTQPVLKPQTLGVLQEMFITLCAHFKKNWNLLNKHLKWISDILQYLPEKSIEILLVVSSNTEDIAARTLISCYLVRTGKKQLSSLRNYIDEGKHATSEEKGEMYAAVYQCFLTGGLVKDSEVNQPEKCISWLLQTVGWIKLLNDTTSQYQIISTSETFLFLTDVCLATIIGCSGLECSYNMLPLNSINHQTLLENLPRAISRLSTKEGWENATEEIISFLRLLLESPFVKENDRYFVKLSLCALRNTQAFKNLEVWTNVISCIYK
ncbi:hypothetical protein JTE90_021439 [Oedothorax gibbosus]|uniref:Focadhesin n=1 Tax=Oedothorax gibbosus TaxID=931172 RepID=A0AAV6VY53_9ARAC|nr:hypothetical protein JTE90_021439 [Oedothorax gibbosus]